TRAAGVELVRDLNGSLTKTLRRKTAGLFDNGVEIGRANGFLLAVEAEHLTKISRHSLGLPGVDVQVRALCGVPAELLLKEVQRVLNGFEGVVDLVRDRRGKASGRGELLRIEEHLLEAAPFQLPEASDVLHDRDDRNNSPP